MKVNKVKETVGKPTPITPFTNPANENTRKIETN